MIIYKACKGAGRLSCSFSRISHSFISRNESLDVPESNNEEKYANSVQLYHFSSIGDDQQTYSGVFMAGKMPCVAMMASDSNVQISQFNTSGSGNELLDPPSFKKATNFLRVHSFHRDGAVVAFTEFNNPNCRNGFIYFNSNVIFK